MNSFTEYLQLFMQDQLRTISKNVDDLDRHVSCEGKTALDEAFYDMQKLYYNMKDYFAVHLISEGKERNVVPIKQEKNNST
eukprot:CAMPEP_0170564048 /NCGR_PEP_ID=MMETSP0211-20121228/70551_1 /TAXON_ID=311385 /ORGANISM="Pseudokeronopsis sp., Strain OXSARD2" /LENGTH=80 /DNA_ID=CAMNT_0010883021 /DNA_START=1108 /DNA_END=1350 /DNA_ORIENTATION=-